MSDAALLRAFVLELAAAGIRDAVICPGSRSTPLALAIRSCAAINARVLLDERSAGFFALGLARVSRRPVAIVVTSGTAVVELGPAVVEAQLSRVPLVVLTADRPAELRDRGAPQTIDQAGVFGRAAKWFAELPLFDGDPATAAHVRGVAGRAVAMAAAGPAGPVHLNLPFREPLLPDGPLASTTEDVPARPFTAVSGGRRTLDDDAIDRLVAHLGRFERGLIVAGPDDDPGLPAALARLADTTGFPILADPLSGLRTGAHDRDFVITKADLLCRPGPWIDAHRPEVVIRTGAMPTSKPIVEMLARTKPELLVLDAHAGWRESALLPATFIHADPVDTALRYAARAGGWRGDRPYDGAWLLAEQAVTEAMDGWLAALDEPFEGAPFPTLAASLPDGAVLWAGSSMPVRDMDTWLPSTDRALTVRSNRGANGIDGVISSALGASAAGQGPVALVVGDVSFLHDLSALAMARRQGLTLTVVLVDNDGGGIFSFLPQATSDEPGTGLPEHYEALFGTPHGTDLPAAIRALGAGYVDVTASGSLRPAIREAVASGGVTVLHLRTHRPRNLQLHRDVAHVAQAALAGFEAWWTEAPPVTATLDARKARRWRR
jgi:2-succinyl-5-enolpyruvyl-6-hydroxy-3-cyclohexene-1-carboxylate synthase